MRMPASPGTPIVFETVTGALVKGVIVHMAEGAMYWKPTESKCGYRNGVCVSSSRNFVHPQSNVGRKGAHVTVIPVEWVPHNYTTEAS